MPTDDLCAVARLDVTSGELRQWRLPTGQRTSEAVFVPRTGGDPSDELDGYLLSLVYDGNRNRSHVAVLDAARLEDGPVARAWFDHFIPITFHGNWIPE